MTKQKPTLIEIAELKLKMDKPRIAASAFGLTGYECSRCGCRFPETRAPKGRTKAETRRLEKIHAKREFARHVCESAAGNDGAESSTTEERRGGMA